jgi:hypothetical protein
LQNALRWLLRRGSPLPIPNREVKPDCADGTAVMWESMSLPFFRKPYSFIWIGFFVIKGFDKSKLPTARHETYLVSLFKI